METDSDKLQGPVVIQRDRQSTQRHASGCWVIFAFLCGSIGGCTVSSGVFHAFMDVDVELHPDGGLLLATLSIMLLCGLLAARLAWRSGAAKG